MGVGPVIAIPKVLEKVGLTKEDVDLFEVCMDTNGRFENVTPTSL